jgi:hypothetical protein
LRYFILIDHAERSAAIYHRTAAEAIKPTPRHSTNAFLDPITIHHVRRRCYFPSLQFVRGKQGMKRETQSSNLANNFWGDRIKGSQLT